MLGVPHKCVMVTVPSASRIFSSKKSSPCNVTYLKTQRARFRILQLYNCAQVQGFG